MYCIYPRKNYSTLSVKIEIEADYLTILNRVINSYEVKPIALTKIELFTDAELSILKSKKISTTKDYYEYFIKNQTISEIQHEKLIYALQIIDLLRINGVGIEFAKILYEMGIKSVCDYKNTKSELILQNFTELNKNFKRTKANLGINDIEYCRRFCEKLDCEL